MEAYENRSAIEERIAAGRRNKKEAGNKYGKLCLGVLRNQLGMLTPLARLLTSY